MHPEADAFLDAIFDHPDDDTPRLVYADWLQEYGQEDYAQFIRLSVKADGGCRSLEERQQVRAERLPFWQRMTAFLSPDDKTRVTIHKYKRGFPGRVDVPAEFFVRTVAHWWPALTPAELAVYAVNGFEDQVASLVGAHLPWLRRFDCDTRVVEGDHDLDRNPPMRGDFLGKIALSAGLPKLEHLAVQIALADASALLALKNSKLALQLESFFLEVRFVGTEQFGFVTCGPKMRPDALPIAIAAFLKGHSDKL